MMDKKTFALGVMIVTAVVLLVGNIVSIQEQAHASSGVVASNRGMQAVTARITSGGDALYLLDNNTGSVAVFTFDAQQRRMVPRVVTNLGGAFPNVPGSGTGGAAPRQR